MRLLPLAAAFILSHAVLAQHLGDFPLWDNGAPGSEGKTGSPVFEAPNASHGYLKVTGIHNPTVSIYLPGEEKATGVAVIIAPGGGHQFLNYDQEGTNVAQYLNSIGVAALVLQYRLAREPGSTYTVEGHALADMQRAIRVTRARAEEGGVDPAKIGIMGFSAGGEVAALAATRFDAGKPDAKDPFDRVSSRPDFVALIYPGIRADTYTIPKDMPFTFMLCADNDRGPATALSVLYPKLKAAGVQTELHIYATGGHGFGINPNTKNPSPAATGWQVRFSEWLKEIGMVKPN